MGSPLVPRMHLFEIDDQEWFHPWFRGRVQAALTKAWNFRLPLLQQFSAAHLASRILARELASSVTDFVFIDFCAGAGGPTPSIEAHLNRQIGATPSSPAATNGHANHHDDDHHQLQQKEPVRFVLTDLHPHPSDWALAAAASPNIAYEPLPVDASAAPPDLLAKYTTTTTTISSSSSPSPTQQNTKKHQQQHQQQKKKKIFRLFNLAFHHFPDPLARLILHDTLATSSGFAILELQDRTLAGLLTTLIFGLGVVATAPYYAWKWRSPMTLFWAWVLPVLPFVLVFDGVVSGLRTRTADEVEALLRSCGGWESGGWEVRSGRERHLWPCGYVSWVICVKNEGGDGKGREGQGERIGMQGKTA